MQKIFIKKLISNDKFNYNDILQSILKKETEEKKRVKVSEEFKLLKNKTGYDYLKFMCKHVKNKTTCRTETTNQLLDERTVFIIEQLNEMGVNYKVVPFTFNNYMFAGYGGPKLANVEAFIPATEKTKSTIIFTAHHDIVNTESENCQDNTASVCNLLDLCSQISRMKKREKNIYIVFTDGEEFGGCGASRLCDGIRKGKYGKVEGIIDLEVTACGSKVWVEKRVKDDSHIANKLAGFKHYNINYFFTPYNQAMTMRTFGIDAVCIGILPKEEAEGMNNSNAYQRSSCWSLCHSILDTFERSANKEDMSRLVKLLKRFINE